MKEHQKYLNEKAKRLQLEDKVAQLEAADFQRKELLRQTEVENQRNKKHIRRLEIRVKGLEHDLNYLKGRC